jgi:hypothetical protein
VEVLARELTVHQVLRDDGADIRVRQMTIAERTGPDGEIGAVITAALTATRADLAERVESCVLYRLFEGLPE